MQKTGVRVQHLGRSKSQRETTRTPLITAISDVNIQKMFNIYMNKAQTPQKKQEN